MDPDKRMLQETYRVTRENNRMLHAMRRSAFFGRIVKVIFYVLILVVAPLWVYTTYLQPVVRSFEQTMQQVQGTNQKAQSEFQTLMQSIEQFASKLPGVGGSSGASAQ